MADGADLFVPDVVCFYVRQYNTQLKLVFPPLWVLFPLVVTDFEEEFGEAGIEVGVVCSQVV